MVINNKGGLSSLIKKNCKMMPLCGALEENSYTTIDDRLYIGSVLMHFPVVVFVVVFFSWSNIILNSNYILSFSLPVSYILSLIV